MSDTVGHQYIFERRKFRQEVMELKDEADTLIAITRELGSLHAGRALACDDDFAGRRTIERTHDVHERTFAGSGLADNGVKRALIKIQVNIVKHLSFDCGAVYLVDVFHL